MSKKKKYINRYSIKDMLNEGKAIGYFPGMYLIYDLPEELKADTDGNISDEAKAKWEADKTASFQKLLDKVKEKVVEITNANLLDETEAQNIDGSETVSAAKRQPRVIIGDLGGFDRDDGEKIELDKGRMESIEAVLKAVGVEGTDLDVKKDAIGTIFSKDGFGAKTGIKAQLDDVFKGMTEKDIDFIAKYDTFANVPYPSTEFGRKLYNIAGGNQPAVGKGEIYFALAVGGTQGSDSGGGPAVDVIKGTMTLNNKELNPSAQGATTPKKFHDAFIEIVTKQNVENNWPDLYKFMGSGHLNILTVNGFKGGDLALSDLQDEFTKAQAIPIRGKKGFKTFKNPLALRKIAKILSSYFHLATTEELLAKASGLSGPHYVSIQGDGNHLVVELETGRVSLPFHSKANRIKYQFGGFDRLVPKPGESLSPEPLPNEATLKKFAKKLTTTRNRIEIKRNEFVPIINTGSGGHGFEKDDTGNIKGNSTATRIKVMKAKLAAMGVNVNRLDDNDIVNALMSAGSDDPSAPKIFSAAEYSRWRKGLGNKAKYAPKIVESTKPYRLKLTTTLGYDDDL